MPFKNYPAKTCNCFVCKRRIDSFQVISYCRQSNEFYGEVLCEDCQLSHRNIYEYDCPPYAMRLRRELYIRGILSDLEKPVSPLYQKTPIHIDLAIPAARLNIEIDGVQHNVTGNQAIIDLKRTYECLKKSYITIRIPNAVFKSGDRMIDSVADIISSIVELRIGQIQH